MTRIKTITDKAQLPPEQQHEWDAILAERGRVRGPFGVMLHSPGLSLGFLGSVAGSHPDWRGERRAARAGNPRRCLRGRRSVPVVGAHRSSSSRGVGRRRHRGRAHRR